MRRAVIFFLLVCFHLLSGAVTAHGDARDQSFFSLAVRAFKKIPAEKIDANSFFAEPSTDGSSNHKNDLIGAEDDDEDDASRRHTPLAKYISTFFHAFLLEQFRPGLTASICDSRHSFASSSPLYISQRVLRI